MLCGRRLWPCTCSSWGTPASRRRAPQATPHSAAARRWHVTELKTHTNQLHVFTHAPWPAAESFCGVSSFILSLSWRPTHRCNQPSAHSLQQPAAGTRFRAGQAGLIDCFPSTAGSKGGAATANPHPTIKQLRAGKQTAERWVARGCCCSCSCCIMARPSRWQQQPSLCGAAHGRSRHVVSGAAGGRRQKLP